MELRSEQLAHLAGQHKANSRAAFLQHFHRRTKPETAKEQTVSGTPVSLFVTQAEADHSEQVSKSEAAGNMASGLVELATRSKS